MPNAWCVGLDAGVILEERMKRFLVPAPSSPSRLAWYWLDPVQAKESAPPDGVELQEVETPEARLSIHLASNSVSALCRLRSFISLQTPVDDVKPIG